MQLNLTIDIDENAGFCFGVKRAIDLAEQILDEGKELYCLGEIVHNREEVDRLHKKGMISITHEQLPDIKEKNVLIRSHGEPPKTYALLEDNNNNRIEATCPIVLKLHQKVSTAGTNHEFVLIFGKKTHPEVIGIIGQLSADYFVFERIEELELSKLPKQLTIFSQTTMDLDAFRRACNYLIQSGFELNVQDTVCRRISGKKEKLAAFAERHDVVIMVAGSNSSNGKVLHEICLSVNPRSYKLTRVEEIQSDWFHPGETVGITGATSTPDWQMKKIAAFLSGL